MPEINIKNRDEKQRNPQNEKKSNEENRIKINQN